MFNTILITIFSVFFFHPIHLTVTNIEYINKTKSFDISIRIFADDLEKIINTQNKIELNLGKKNELNNSNFYIDKYISSHLSLNINGKNINPKKFILKKKEIKDITVWLSYNVKFTETIKNVEIKNDLLTDLYYDQKNLLIFTFNNKETPLEFNTKTTTNFIKF